MLGFPKRIQDLLLFFVNYSFYFVTFEAFENVFIFRKVIEYRNKSHAHGQNTLAMFFILVF